MARHSVLGLSLVLLSATAGYAGPPVSLPTVPTISRGMPGTESDLARSGGLANEWRFRREWASVAQSYAGALQFARCARRFNPAAADRMLSEPIGNADEMADWRQIVRQNRACVGEQGAVSPLLLRAALAETRLLASDGNALPRSALLGVPDTVDGYPLRSIARCQRASAPTMVDAVLATAPGSEAERANGEALFQATAGCGASRLGRLNPTVARIALIDAAWTQISRDMQVGQPGSSRDAKPL